MSSVQTLTVVKTDVRGFTSRSAQMTSSSLDSFLHAHREAVVRVMREFAGTIVKEMGDSFLVTFASSTSALSACIMLQRKLGSAPSPGAPSARIEVRITVSAGDVLVQAGDIFGTPVNLAARLESVTPPGEIYFTEAVYQNMNRNEIASEPVGDFRFDGIGETISVYRTTFRHQTREMLAAVLFTDIEKFSGFAETAPIGEVEMVLQNWEEAHQIAAESNGGVVQYILGDAQLLTFDTAIAAVEAWLTIFLRVQAFNQRQETTFNFQFRAGIDVGDVRIFRSAMYGRVCNHASNFSAICPVSAVLVRDVFLEGVSNDLRSRICMETLDPQIPAAHRRAPMLLPLLPITVVTAKNSSASA